jgi:ABC-type transporter Mla subunit MlaD
VPSNHASQETATMVRTVAVPETLEDLTKLVVNMSTLLDTFATKLNNCNTIPSHLEKLEDKLATMETKLNDTLKENNTLKKELASKTNVIIGDLQQMVNNHLNGQNKVDQYMCSWSTTAKEEQCPFAMKSSCTSWLSCQS